MKRSILKSTLSLFILGGLFLSGASGLNAKGNTSFTLNETVITHDNKEYNFNQFSEKTHSYDFTETSISAYSDDQNIITKSLRTNMIFENGTLMCKENGTYSFGSAVFMGDPYGLYNGNASFDLEVTDGSLYFGMRLTNKIAATSESGLWFEFTKDGITVSEGVSGFSANVPLTFSEQSHIDILDEGDFITLTVNGEKTAEINILNNALVVFDKNAKAIGHKTDVKLQSSGYISIYADSHKGYVDNFTFNEIDVTQFSPTTNKTIDYSTWVATDDLGRVVSDATGEEQKEKQVGIFYFLCQTGDDSGVIKDNTKLYLTLGLEGLQKYYTDPVNAGSYFWAEPYFGYYRNTDKWVYRKHAFQLEAAGVDFIFIDVSNGITYNEGLTVLFDTWLSMRKSGISTPDICFLGGGNIENSLNSLKKSVYSEENFDKYRELFYEYENKPLILADKNALSDANKEFLKDFTIRNCWAWKDENGCWNWLQEYVNNPNGSVSLSNGGWGRDENGNKEALALCIGHHPTTSKGRSYADGTFPKTDDFGFSLDSDAGLGLEAQFKAIQKLNPKVMLITGWNEWIAGLAQTNTTSELGGKQVEGYYFVDQFNPEYSRDGEPMKLRDGVGFGDNYYYQLCKYIREFKGMKATDTASVQGTVNLSDFSDWEKITQIFDDTVGDTAYRSEIGFYSNMTYVNNTGRNDFDILKASSDNDYLYFYAKCANDIVTDDGKNWMNLFINTDGDMTNGWEGYDFVINRYRDGFYASVLSLAKGWNGENAGQALYTVSGKEMAFRVSKSLLGIDGNDAEIVFKWADNSTLDGNVMEFMDLGDTAPNDRFAFKFKCTQGETSPFTYTLTDKNGNAVEARNEANAFPGIEDEVPELSEDEASEDEQSNGSDEEISNSTQESNEGRGTIAIIICAVVVLISVIAAIMLPKKTAKK